MGDFDWMEQVKMVTTLKYPESWTHDKLSREDTRRFIYLTYKHGGEFYWKEPHELKKYLLSLPESTHHGMRKDHNERMEIFNIAEKYNISDEDLKKLCLENSRESDINSKYYNPRPWDLPKTMGVRRDNKGVYVGGGGSNRNKVRYPSKKRSKRVWKTFYKMFPYYAERDGWDGTKSSRVDFSKKKK
jgi:hypothetical protein